MGGVEESNTGGHNQLEPLNRILGQCCSIQIVRVDTGDSCHGFQHGFCAHALNGETNCGQVELTGKDFFPHRLENLLAGTSKSARNFCVLDLEPSIVSGLWVSVVIPVGKSCEFFGIFKDPLLSDGDLFFFLGQLGWFNNQLSLGVLLRELGVVLSSDFDESFEFLI